ncbi:MAG: sigma 54-interacting transcriptional regulator [Syntrophaceae bacterium]|nr:sigma 54-interacting transcriptional regulator [Syntrophaceae bacterium]
MEKREPEKFFNIIFNSIADGVFTTDGEGRITFFNKAGEEITGFSSEEAIGRYCYEIFRADICQSRCVLKEVLKTEKEIINLPVIILNKYRKKIPISISAAVLRDEKGEVIGGVETFRDLSVIEELKKELSQKYTFGDIVSKNHFIHDLFNILPNISGSDSTVLIQGASGTGKELFAKAIHNLSPRKNKPFIKVNCGALPDTLLESELFGYEKGAFTDAKKDKPGRFALANGGTIFLDEVGDMSPSLQVKLLLVLQEKEYEPLGSTSPRKTDVRVIAATNKDLSKLVNEGKFRDDLYSTGEMDHGIKEQSLVIKTSKGMILITGCAHPGIIEIIIKAKTIARENIYMAIGGWHLCSAGEREIKGMIEAFLKMGIQKVAPCHCTGDRAMEMFKREYGKNFIKAGVGKIILIEGSM